MKAVSLLFPYYDNPRMLERQLEQLSRYDPATLRALRLVVVDDGSQRHPARIASCPVPFELYRCLVDVRWNWIFCRNLGVSRASTDWVVMTDIDHLVPAATARALVFDEHAEDVAYTFSRVSARSGEKERPHANSWFMTRRLFDAVGGYDERFAGCYGSDFDFAARVRATATVTQLASELERVPRSLVSDASTTRYKRTERLGRIPKILRQRGGERPLRLTFPWERVK
jgi:hypothetical protein